MKRRLVPALVALDLGLVLLIAPGLTGCAGPVSHGVPHVNGAIVAAAPVPASDASGQRVSSPVHSPGRRTPHPVASRTPAGKTSKNPSATSPSKTSSTERVDCQQVKCVALTFDDGPGPYTNQILDALDQADAKATFFEIGEQVPRYPATVRRQVESGHALGNHTWDHVQLTTVGRGTQAREASKTSDALVAAGAPRPTLLRPPYGSFDASTKTLPYAIVTWDVDSLDWKNRNASTTTRNVLREVRPGSIVLMHDIVPSTARALPGLLAQLKADGYHLVTVPTLFGGRIEDGVVYRAS